MFHLPSRISLSKKLPLASVSFSFLNSGKATVRQMATRPRVLVTRGDIPQTAIELLRDKCDLEVAADGQPMPRDELLKRIEGKHGLFCFLSDKIDAELLDKAGSQLKVISTMSVGFDHINIPEVKNRGILVGNTPGVLTSATAELTLALTLATTRRLFEANQEIFKQDKHGGWAKTGWSPLWLCGNGLVQATVGIVGFGSIGLAVAKRLIPFEVKKILYCGNSKKPYDADVSAEFVSFNDLLRDSDVVIVTCPLNDSTRNMFGAAQFNLMKKNAVFINTSRGGVVDQDALVDALKSEKIGAAGLDVMTPEPLPSDHELTKLKNCVLIPHIGSATIQTRTAMANLTAQNIINALEGKQMPAQLC